MVRGGIESSKYGIISSSYICGWALSSALGLDRLPEQFPRIRKCSENVPAIFRLCDRRNLHVACLRRNVLFTTNNLLRFSWYQIYPPTQQENRYRVLAGAFRERI